MKTRKVVISLTVILTIMLFGVTSTCLSEGVSHERTEVVFDAPMTFGISIQDLDSDGKQTAIEQDKIYRTCVISGRKVRC